MPPSGFTVRTFELKDLGQILTIEKESFPDQPYGGLDFLSYSLTSREGFMVACSNEGLVVGYAIAEARGLEGSIQSIAVSPPFRGRGIGEMLMRNALEYLAKWCVRARLLVDVENASAIRLYLRLSFEKTGRVVERYYPNGNDAIEMTRELGP
ncbi:MAG TPA: N-acetyltransferase [Nitrososphaerales archaeon]|nr:N-acetyltransferase [Nitrososphaerales archaeon]